MGVLFLAKLITKPSVVWMRRMLDGLEGDVTLLASRTDLAEDDYERFETLRLVGERSLLSRIGIGRSRGSAGEKLARAVARDDVDCVLVHYVDEAVRFSAVWGETDKPVFVHCHGADVTWGGRNQVDGGRRSLPVDYVEQVRRLPENVHFIANSRVTAGRLEEIGLPAERMTIKHLGVEVPEACPARPRRDPVTILYLGNLVDCKGPDLTLRAFERACELGLRGRLVVAGGGPLWIACELIRVRSPVVDRIELLGPVDEETGRRLREEADIFTAHNCRGPVSDQEEAFGVSYVEAMSQALPLVTGRNGSLPEIVNDCEQGFLVEPGDVEAHARALLQLAAAPELRERMGRSGWERARDHFTLEHEMKQLRSILNLSG